MLSIKNEAKRVLDIQKETHLSRTTIVLNLLQLSINKLMDKIKEKQYLYKSPSKYILNDLGREKLIYLEKLNN